MVSTREVELSIIITDVRILKTSGNKDCMSSKKTGTKKSIPRLCSSFGVCPTLNDETNFDKYQENITATQRCPTCPFFRHAACREEIGVSARVENPRVGGHHGNRFLRLFGILFRDTFRDTFFGILFGSIPKISSENGYRDTFRGTFRDTFFGILFKKIRKYPETVSRKFGVSRNSILRKRLPWWTRVSARVGACRRVSIHQNILDEKC